MSKHQFNMILLFAGCYLAANVVIWLAFAAWVY